MRYHSWTLLGLAASLNVACVVSDKDSDDDDTAGVAAGATANADGTFTNPDGTVVNADGTAVNPGVAGPGAPGSVPPAATNPDGTVTPPPVTTDGVTPIAPPGDGEIPPGPRCIQELTTIAQGTSPLIDDIEDGDGITLSSDGRGGEWIEDNDGTGTATLSFEAAAGLGAAPGSTTAIRYQGNGFTEWGAQLILRPAVCYNAAAYDGISFYIKANDAATATKSLKFSVATPPTQEVDAGGDCIEPPPAAEGAPPVEGCYDHFALQNLITLQPDWNRVSIPWAELKQAGWGRKAPAGFTPQSQVLLFSFTLLDGDNGAGAFDFSIDDPSLAVEESLGCSDIVSEQQFNAWFPNRNPFYTYNAMVAAAKTFSRFCADGDDAARKREAAAFFAHVHLESNGLGAVNEFGCPGEGKCSNDYCNQGTPEQNAEYPCAAGQNYFGRGPLQLSHNYIYGPAGEALGLPLLSNPGLLGSDPVAAFRGALWFWHETVIHAALESPHRAIVGGKGFGRTIDIINGALECRGGPNPASPLTRIANFQRFASDLGVDPGGNLNCL